MSIAYLDIAISLDGFAAGPGVSHQHPLGVGGEALHAWIDGAHPADAAARRAMFAEAGAVVLGRTMFDLGEPLWGDDGAFGLPCFVVTHRPRAPLVKGPTRFIFAATLAEAFASARAVAGSKRIGVAGGPSMFGGRPGSGTPSTHCAGRACWRRGAVSRKRARRPSNRSPNRPQGVATHWRFAINP